MRLGEIKKILDENLDENSKLSLLVTNQNSAYVIANFAEIIDVLHILIKQIYFAGDIQAIVDEFPSQWDSPNTVQSFSQQEYSFFSQQINRINSKIPPFYSVLDSVASEQDSQLINVKLPEKDNLTLSELTKITASLDKIFKTINIDGDIQFKGFDTGSAWYEILIVGVITYKVFIEILKGLQEVYKTRKEYFASEHEKVRYLAALKEGEKESEDSRKAYVERVIDKENEFLAKNVLEKVTLSGKGDKNEVENKIRATIKLLRDAFEEGVEFHLSLNPPDYLEEERGKIHINYEKLREIQAKEKEAKKITKVEENNAEK